MKKFYRNIILSLTLLILLSINGFSQNESVDKILNSDGSIKLGTSGSFNAAGYELNYGANGQPILQKSSGVKASSSVTWSTLGTGRDGVNGTINSLVVMGTDIYVGGTFDIVGDIRAKHIAKWNTVTNTWSTLGSGVSNGLDGDVRTMVVSGTDIYIGGSFSMFGDGITPANHIAKWSTTSNSWSVLPRSSTNGTNGDVKALAISGTDLYVGGDFTVPGSYIAKWSIANSTWSVLGTSSTNNGISSGYVSALAIKESDLYVGGSFTKLGNNTLANNVAKYNTSTSTWSALTYGTSNGVLGGSITQFAVIGADVYMAGYFTKLGDGTTSASYLAKWNTTSSQMSTIPSGTLDGLGGSVYALTANGTDLYISGSFNTLGDGKTTVGYICKLNTINNTWSNFPTGTSAGLNSYANSIVFVGSDLYAGGSMSMSGTKRFNSFCKWNSTDGWAAIGSGSLGLDKTVNAIALYNGEVYLAGNFNTTGDRTSASRLVKWNPLTNVWSSVAGGANNEILAMVVNGSNLYIAGKFTSVGGYPYVTVKNIAKLDLLTNKWSALSSGLSYNVYSLAIIGNDLYAGGDFTTLGSGTSANYVAKWNMATSTWSTLPSGTSNGVNNFIRAFAVKGTDLYMGGGFNFLGDGKTAVSFIVKYNTLTGAWSPLPIGTKDGVAGQPYALAISGDDLYVGGNFTKLGDNTTSAKYIAKWNTVSNTWSTLGSGSTNGFATGILNCVKTLAVSGNNLYVGGFFRLFGDSVTPANHFAKWNMSTNTWHQLSDKGSIGIDITLNDGVKALMLNPYDGKLLVGGDFTTAGTKAVLYVAEITDADNPMAVERSHFTGNASNFKLAQNYPNPFNPSTIISYSIPNIESVRLKIYDILGKEVVTLVNEKQNAGSYNIRFNASMLSSGIYIARLEAGNFSKSIKMQLIK